MSRHEAMEFLNYLAKNIEVGWIKLRIEIGSGYEEKLKELYIKQIKQVISLLEG